MDDYKLKKKFLNLEEIEDMSQEKDSSKINDKKNKIKILKTENSYLIKMQEKIFLIK